MTFGRDLPHPSRSRRPSARAALVALVFSAMGCGTSDKPAAGPRDLRSYTGRTVELFDDTIEPAAVGLDFDKGYQPRTDPSFRERVQAADAVLRVRVSTVTTKTDGPAMAYQIALHTVEKLGGSRSVPTDFTVAIGRTSASHGIMKNFEGRLVGYAFVAFVREAAKGDGDVETHFHLAPDTKDVKLAVGDALLLGELK